MKRIVIAKDNHAIIDSSNISITFGNVGEETKEYDASLLTDKDIEDIKKNPKNLKKHMKQLKSIEI